MFDWPETGRAIDLWIEPNGPPADAGRLPRLDEGRAAPLPAPPPSVGIEDGVSVVSPPRNTADPARPPRRDCGRLPVTALPAVVDEADAVVPVD